MPDCEGALTWIVNFKSKSKNIKRLSKGKSMFSVLLMAIMDTWGKKEILELEWAE